MNTWFFQISSKYHPHIIQISPTYHPVDIFYNSPLIIQILPDPNIIQIQFRYHPDIIQIQSRYHPDIIQISSRYHPDIIQIQTRYHPDIIQITSRYHPDIIQISSRYNPDIIQSTSFLITSWKVEFSSRYARLLHSTSGMLKLNYLISFTVYMRAKVTCPLLVYRKQWKNVQK